MQQFSVGFRIFDALALQTSDGNPCDCFCVVECCGNRFQTNTLTEAQAICLFNEACTWPKLDLFEKEFESASIDFTLYERCWFVRDKVIGRASLQLSYINNRRNHLYARTWLQLRREGETETKGQLNVSVFCINSTLGESAPSATEQISVAQEEVPEEPGEGAKTTDDDDIRGVILSKDIKAPPGKPHHVFINIHRVEDLAPVSYGTFPSPFVTVEFNGCQVSTRVGPEGEQYAFSESARIPVMTPVFEDVILIKLWSRNYFQPDELLAQGLISFSELRNNALSPQWFNLYGWDLTEVPDLENITKAGERLKPNKFKGRFLLSGRVDKVEEDEELQPAAIVAAKTVEEPQLKQVALLADVYMVVGLPGRTAKVQLSYGKNSSETMEAYSSTQQTDLKSSKADEEANDEVTWGDEETTTVFNFKDKEGRLEPPIMCMTPDDSDSQPDVMVSVMTATMLGSYQRVAWCMCKLHEFTQYEPGCPTKPKFLALEPMPGAASATGASVLITIEYNNSDDVIRHRRKQVRPMLYIVRTYAFMARSIDYAGADAESPANYALKVTCSGMVRRTKYQEEVRPRWMEYLNLKVVLCSDQHGEPPTCEPIHVSLVDGRGTGDVEIGKATCLYTLMRKKDTLGEWEPYELSPQWIRIFGGPYGGKPIAEVLVAFELLMWKTREDPALMPREMWPQPEEIYNEQKHFSKLRRATLHFALMGLRDIPKLPRLAALGSAGGFSHVDCPEVKISLPSWYNKEFDEREDQEEDEKTFVYMDTVPGGDSRLKESQLRKWKSKRGLYAQGGMFAADPELMNFEFLTVGKLCIEIPDQMILQPYIRIQVYDNSGVVFGKTFIGESLQTLAYHLPCCWYPNVDVTKGYDEQKEHIDHEVHKAQHDAAVRERFQQMSKEEYEEFLKQERAEKFALQMSQQKHLVKLDAEAPARIDNFAMPIELKLVEDHKRPLILNSPVALNMQTEKGFSPRCGRVLGADDGATTACHGKLEYDESFKSTIWFQNYPLLRNRDMVGALSNSYDWNFGDHCGFLKCAYKLVDDWEEEKEEGEEEAEKKEDDDDDEEKVLTDEEKLKQTYGLDPEMSSFAFHPEKFVQKWKSIESTPSRIRVRVYLLKAICIWAKGSGFAEPYLTVQLGRSNSMSMKNVRCGETNTPDFGLFEERDIELPMDGRLEVSVMDSNDYLADDLIGSTIIDLEDRWHCKKWNKLNQRQIIPYESRNFYQPGNPAQNFGAIEMMVEMLDSSEASDKKPSQMPKLAGTLVDVRIVIRSAEVMTLSEDELIDVQIGCALMCDKYEGPYPTKQVTDVHYGSSGPCKYDWRVVYPQIRSPILSCIVEVYLYKFAQIAGNTLLGSVRLDMKRYVERVAENMDKIQLPPVPLKMQGGPNDDPDEDIGTVTLEACILSYAEALENKAGIAREQPNQNPALFAPTEGRGWDAFFAGFSIPWPNWWKKLIPLVIAAMLFLASVVVMKQMGLM